MSFHLPDGSSLQLDFISSEFNLLPFWEKDCVSGQGSRQWRRRISCTSLHQINPESHRKEQGIVVVLSAENTQPGPRNRLWQPFLLMFNSKSIHILSLNLPWLSRVKSSGCMGTPLRYDRPVEGRVLCLSAGLPQCTARILLSSQSQQGQFPPPRGHLRQVHKEPSSCLPTMC